MRMSEVRIQVRGVLDTRAHLPVCLHVTDLASGSSIASIPPYSLTWKETPGQFGVTVDIMACFIVMEVVKPCEISVFHIQGLGFPCILSACVQYILMLRLYLVLGKWKWVEMLWKYTSAPSVYSQATTFLYAPPFILLCMYLQTSSLRLPGNCVTHPSECYVKRYQALASEIPATSWI